MMTRLIGALMVTLLVSLQAMAPARAAELLVFEAPGCPYCEKWNAEVGDAYPKTWLAEVAPIRRINLAQGIPDDLKAAGLQVRYTPTFVVWHDNQEVDRIEGYELEDFFWPVLERILRRLPQDEAAPGAPGDDDPA